jgi:diguanylate cyclase (GGDEF)-like protein/PAS domain S-box-containing protein
MANLALTLNLDNLTPHQHLLDYTGEALLVMEYTCPLWKRSPDPPFQTVPRPPAIELGSLIPKVQKFPDSWLSTPGHDLHALMTHWRIVAASPKAQELLNFSLQLQHPTPLNTLPPSIAAPLLHCLAHCLETHQPLSLLPGWSTCLPTIALMLHPHRWSQSSTSFPGQLPRIVARLHPVQPPSTGTLTMQSVAELALQIAATDSAEGALDLILRQICQMTGWDYGEVWLPHDPAEGGDPYLECSPLWFSSDQASWQQFRACTARIRFGLGEGLPGRVWQTQRPEWIPQAHLNSQRFFVRANLTQVRGLKAGLGVPIVSGGEVLAVLVFFMLEQRQENEELVAFVSTLATHMGAVLQRKKAETALQNQEIFLRLVLDTIPMGVFWKDRHLVYQGGNRQWLQDQGLVDLQGIQGKTADCLHEETVAYQCELEDQQILAQNLSILHQVRVRQRPDGSILYQDLSKVPIYDATNNLLGVLGVYEDITERHHAEMALALRERYMAAIVEVQRLLLNYTGESLAYGAILQRLGEVSGADRIYWAEDDRSRPDQPRAYIQSEWLSDRRRSYGDSSQPMDSTRMDSTRMDSTFAAIVPDAGDACPLKFFTYPQWIESLQEGQPLAYMVTTVDPEDFPPLWDDHAKAVLLLPFMVYGQFFGFLGLEKDDPVPWTEVESDMLQMTTLSIALMQEHRQVLQSLQQAESKYRSIFENALEGIFQTTLDGYYRIANPILAKIYGYESPQELIEQVQDIRHQLYLHQEDRERFVEVMNRDGLVRNFEAPVRRKDGQTIWISEYARVMRDDHGEIIGYEGIVQDITDRKQAEADLQKRDRLLQGLAQATHCLLTNPHFAEAIPEVLAILGEAAQADRVYLYENHPHSITGQEAMSMRFEWVREGIAPSIHQPHWQDQSYHEHGLERWLESFRQGQSVGGWVRDFPESEQVLLARDDIQGILMVPVLVDDRLWGFIGFDECQETALWNQGESTILTTLATSLGSALKRQETERIMEYQAFHDSLTELPNRVMFNQHLPMALDRARSRQESLAVMFLDLDRFKTINDSLGHAVGDQLLQEATLRMTSVLRDNDLISRWGGDEFTLCLHGIHNPEEVAAICRRLLEVLRPPIVIQGHEIHVSASIGIALYPQDGDNAATLLSYADMAMYRVKEEGRSHYRFYCPTMNDHASKTWRLEQDLHHALDRGQLRIHYQPRVDAITGEVLQVEALLRWIHPDQGWVSPGVFIPMAENNGLMQPIGEWVLRSACTQAKIWMEQGFNLGVAVNLSPYQFRNVHLVNHIRQILLDTHLPATYLELEITESIVMEDVKFACQLLTELRAMGVRLSLDDFGTGYSSLSYLKSFPIHTLKIDQTFVQGLPKDLQDMAIVATIVALGQGLGLQVVAEGVETWDQLMCLQALECTEVQGFLISKAIPGAAMTDFLLQHQGFVSLDMEEGWIVGVGGSSSS